MTRGCVALLAATTVAAAAGPIRTVPGAAWARHTIDNTSRGADGVKLGDLNGDGRLDIVSGWEEGGEVRVYLNPGPAKARDPWPRVTVGKVGNVEEAIFADLDGDGRLDVVSGTEGRTCTIYWHRFTGQSGELLRTERWRTEIFPATQSAAMWMQAAALDLDGQRGAELLLGAKNEGATIGWLQAPERPHDLAAWSYHALRPTGWIMSLLPHDMDGDADPDLVFTDRKGERTGLAWLENPGASANLEHREWREHPIGALGRQVMFADLGDVNGDGLLDAAVAVKPNDVFLCLQKAGRTWREQILSLDATNLGDAKAVKIADLNRDGLADLIYTCENAKGPREGIVWLEQQRDGTWLQRTLGGPEGVKFDLVQSLDLDADGDLDVLTCEERDQLGVIWYENPHSTQTAR